jgi:tetratricopeptide (TPR) repeat protein
MKIGIYAPAKNELKHCSDWYESCKNADTICVADTGSTDGTKEKLIELGVSVTSIRILPFRFDDAFNAAMYLLPDDIDVCIRLDLDERLQPGWREGLEKAWTPQTTRLRYPYVWNWVAPGIPGRTWMSDRIHARAGFRWMGATHEGLVSRGPEVQTFTNDVKIWQFPDPKTKPGDLALLLESVREWPNDSRILAYLGREYYYRKDYINAIKTYKEFLEMSTDSVERGQAMINLSVADSDNKVFWLKMAMHEVPNHREPLVNLAQHYYNISDWKNCYEYAKKAIEKTTRQMDYTETEEAWGSLPWDLASLGAWNLNLIQDALIYAEKAVELDQTNDVRLKNNVMYIKNRLDLLK